MIFFSKKLKGKIMANVTFLFKLFFTLYHPDISFTLKKEDLSLYL